MRLLFHLSPWDIFLLVIHSVSSRFSNHEIFYPVAMPYGKYKKLLFYNYELKNIYIIKVFNYIKYVLNICLDMRNIYIIFYFLSYIIFVNF